MDHVWAGPLLLKQKQERSPNAPISHSLSPGNVAYMWLTYFQNKYANKHN